MWPLYCFVCITFAKGRPTKMNRNQVTTSSNLWHRHWSSIILIDMYSVHFLCGKRRKCYSAILHDANNQSRHSRNRLCGSFVVVMMCAPLIVNGKRKKRRGRRENWDWDRRRRHTIHYMNHTQMLCRWRMSRIVKQHWGVRVTLCFWGHVFSLSSWLSGRTRPTLAVVQSVQSAPQSSHAQNAQKNAPNWIYFRRPHVEVICYKTRNKTLDTLVPVSAWLLRICRSIRKIHSKNPPETNEKYFATKNVVWCMLFQIIVRHLLHRYYNCSKTMFATHTKLKTHQHCCIANPLGAL